MTCQCGAGAFIVETSFLLGISIERFMLPCQTKRILGFDCPGCGFQRAVQFIINGEFWAAFKMYPAIYPLLLLGFVIGLSRFQPKVNYQKQILLLAFTTVGLILANFIYKLII